MLNLNEVSFSSISAYVIPLKVALDTDAETLTTGPGAPDGPWGPGAPESPFCPDSPCSPLFPGWPSAP